MSGFAAPARHLATGILPRDFYDRSVHAVARDLLGMILVRMPAAAPGCPGRLAGRIVEAEAYDGPDDLACHASKGRTERTDVMFGEAGHAYVYLVYGMHWCLNVVTGPVGYPAARQAGARRGARFPGPAAPVHGGASRRGASAFLTRRFSRKKSRSREAHSSARTSPVTWKRWLRRAARDCRSSRVAPIFGSRAP